MVEPGIVVLGKYRVERVIGKGGMSLVAAAVGAALAIAAVVVVLARDGAARARRIRLRRWSRWRGAYAPVYAPRPNAGRHRAQPGNGLATGGLWR